MNTQRILAQIRAGVLGRIRFARCANELLILDRENATARDFDRGARERRGRRAILVPKRYIEIPKLLIPEDIP